MNCPTDGTVLLMSERTGVEIDYCPTCRGVWLDRGELDRIIERVEGSGTGRSDRSSSGRSDRSEPRRENEHRYNEHRYVEHRYGDRPKKKKKGVLSEIFDFE